VIVAGAIAATFESPGGTFVDREIVSPGDNPPLGLAACDNSVPLLRARGHFRTTGLDGPLHPTTPEYSLPQLALGTTIGCSLTITGAGGPALTGLALSREKAPPEPA